MKNQKEFPFTPNVIMPTFKNIGLEIAIPDLQFIINVDFPPNLQTYMDRLRKGVVHYTLFCREDAKHAERLIYSLKQTRQDFDTHLHTMAKAWLECGRDIRFMPMGIKSRLWLMFIVVIESNRASHWSKWKT
jgi:hypothetical protein